MDPSRRLCKITEIHFGEFDPDKFTCDIMADPPPTASSRSGKAGGGKGGEQNPEGKWEAGGDKKDAKPETKDNPGLKCKKEPAEDVSKMTNDQKFIRACEKIGKIGDDAKSKPLALMQLQEEAARKAAAEVPLKLESTYGIQSISIKDKDGEAKVTVKHPGKEKQNTNEKEPIKVRLMTVAEMMKLAEAGKKDLEDEAARKAAAEVPLISEDPKVHTMKETDAQAIVEEVKGAHYVFEDVTVAQKGDRWEYVLNLAGKTMAVPGSGVEKEKEGQGKDGGKEGDKPATEVDLSTKVRGEFTDKGKDGHKIYPRKKKDGSYDLIIESTPTIYADFIEALKIPATATKEQQQLKIDTKALAARIDGMLDKLATGKAQPTDADVKGLDALVDTLAKKTLELMNLAYGATVPAQQVNFGGLMDGAFGSSMSINYLSSHTTGEESSTIKYIKHGVLDKRRNGGVPMYLRGHLLNANLHGPNEWKNLTPLTYTANSNHKTQVENKLKEATVGAGEPPKSSGFRAFRYVVIPNYGRGVNEGLIKQVENSTNPDVIANKALLIEIIKAEAFVPLHLKIEAVELVPNSSGQWLEGPKVFMGTIPNEVDQTKPEAYNLDGSKVDPITEINIDKVTTDILEQWFSETNSAAIMLAVEERRPKIKNHEDLHKEALDIQGETDGRKLPLATLKLRIKF